MTHARQMMLTSLFLLRSFSKPVQTSPSPTTSHAQLVTMETQPLHLVTMETHGPTPSLPPRLRECYHYDYHPSSKGTPSPNAIFN